MTSVSLFVFFLGALFGSGSFFRKGGEMLVTYVLFPVILVTIIMAVKTDDTELFFGQVNRSALYGGLLGAASLAGYHIIQIRQAGGLSLARFKAGFVPLLRFNLKTLWASGQRRAEAAQANARTASTVYYRTAVKLGAITTAIDRTRSADGFSSVKATFNLSRATCPEALNIFNTQMRRPQRLRAILKPFVNQYGRESAIAETLIFGMCKVALADGDVSLAEIRLIDQAAEILGLHPIDTRRVIASAGVEIEDEFGANGTSWQKQERTGFDYGYRSGRGANGAGQTSAPPRNIRTAHLATLGLPANANVTQARKAWRKLAVKYHPDKLVSQNLPAHEMAKAEAMMQAINEAYDWLKDNSK